jgi:hypothetical protein
MTCAVYFAWFSSNSRLVFEVDDRPAVVLGGPVTLEEVLQENSGKGLSWHPEYLG